MTWTACSEAPPRGVRFHPFQNQLTNHSNKRRVRSHGSGAHHVEADCLTVLACFGVQIVEHFHVVRYEAYGSNNNVGNSFGLQVREMLQDVRFEPRLGRRPAAALVNQTPALQIQVLSYQPANFASVALHKHSLPP